MNSSVETIPWTVITPSGTSVSTVLPRVVHTFSEFVLVDIYSGDSDPVYWAVAGARLKWGDEWATRFSVAMLAYYHTGTALRAAEHTGWAFWDYLAEIYPTNPRGSERRHFRGQAGLNCLKSMRAWSPHPENFFVQFPNTYFGVKDLCERKLVGFGPYFQLKICDYMDRCLDYPIKNYAGLGRNLPTEPAKAAQLMYPTLNVEAAFNQAGLDALTIPPILAAPHFDRPIGPAEIETSLCGWKTTKFKGNWFGADVEDKRLAMSGYGGKADEMLDMFPPLVKKGTFTCNL